MKDSLIFHLGNFSGPLAFLIALIQNNELNIEDITLKEILDQYFKTMEEDLDLESGAEFVGSASLLIWLKSKLLLPSHEQTLNLEEEQDPRFEIIHHLIDYCRFREAAKSLTAREVKQNSHYYRGIDNRTEVKKTLGIEHLSLEDFASLFKKLSAKAVSNHGVIQEEEWKVSDKIDILRLQLSQRHEIPFNIIFNDGLCREELIVIFLAVLELMKAGELCIIKMTDTDEIFIGAKKKYGQRD